jgi:hypothetical protein
MKTTTKPKEVQSEEGLILQEIKNELNTTELMINSNIETPSTKMIQMIAHNPLEGFAMGAMQLDIIVKNNLHSQIIDFFTQNAHLVRSYSRVSAQDLAYYIVLHKDTLKNRSPFFSYSAKHEQTMLGDKYPIYFGFVPQELEYGILNRVDL